MEIGIGKPILVYSPPVNEETKKWGVYCIPRLWRDISGKLIVRFNGEADSGICEQCAPDLYFISEDEGESWKPLKEETERYDLRYLTGINPPFVRLRNGDLIGIRPKAARSPVSGIRHLKEYENPCGSSIIRVYRYGELPQDSVGLELFRKHKETETLEAALMDFPEREVMITAKGRSSDGSEWIEIPEYVQSNLFVSPYLTGITELSGGSLAAVAHGQTPSVSDRQCEDAYLVVSEDGGKSWRLRSVIASAPEMPFGCCGDGGEISLTMTSDGSLICAMRTDMSIEGYPSDTLICRSEDQGYSWTKPQRAADSSVTPHVISLSDGIVLLIYGRPGVHFKISEDNGKTWSGSYPIIGKTLSEELYEGKSYMDAKYFDTISYSNTFVEKLSDHSVLVLYNDLQYDEGDGQKHKAAFVRKITIKKS